MGFLAVSIAFNVTFALLTRVAQARGYDFFLVTAVNYVTALAAALIWFAWQPVWAVDLPSVAFGMLQGVQYGVTIVGIYFLLTRLGVGVTFTLIRLSVIVPTLVSVAVFGERASAAALAGVGLMLLSIPLVTVRRERRAPAVATAWWVWPGLLALLLFTGAGLTAAKAFDELSTPDHRPAFLLATFATAVAVALVTFALRRRLQPSVLPLRELWSGRRRALVAPLTNGLVMGAANLAQLAFFVLALRVVPGTVAFPIHTSVAVLLTTAAGALFWRERHGVVALAGVAMALAGFVLVNV
jgi:drug/metabolite transporter (DMT)-like permease